MGDTSITPSIVEAEDTPPRTRGKRLRKDEIVAEATRLFAERGYEGASMGELAERVGLRKASLFHHFQSKDVLYAAVFSRLVTGVRAALAAAVLAEGSFVDRLDALTDALTAILGAEPFTARLLLREAMDWGPVMRDHLGSAIDEVLAVSTELTRAGQRVGVFDPGADPAHLVVSVVGICFIPFIVDRTVERLSGRPFDPAFVEERRRVVREQVRRLVLLPV